MKSYKQLNLPFVVNASLSFNVTLQGSKNVEYVENEEFELLVDPNKYVTVIFVDFDIDKYDYQISQLQYIFQIQILPSTYKRINNLIFFQLYVKIPKFDAPLSGVFRDVVFNLTHPHIPSEQHQLTVRCFLTKRKNIARAINIKQHIQYFNQKNFSNNYTSLGYSGYLGIAPFGKDQKMNERFSFTQQLRSIMNIQSIQSIWNFHSYFKFYQQKSNKQGIHYYIHKTFDLGLNSGRLEFLAIDDQNPDTKQFTDTFKTKKLINLTYNSTYPAGKLKVESTDKMNPFENVQAIDLGNYMRSLKIQEYHHFDNSTYDSSHSTFVNMSEYGIFLNSGKFIQTILR